MELRLAKVVLRLLDPRRWRQRLRQLGCALLGVGWLWYRSVDRAALVARRRDASHIARSTRLRAAQTRAEHARDTAAVDRAFERVIES